MSFLAKLDLPEIGKDSERVIVLQRDGCVLRVGLNAASNEKIISEHEHPNCLALHAWGAKGSYVVLCGQGSYDFTDAMILFAAQTALKHSRSELKSVIYCRLRELFKPENAAVGVFRSHRQGRLDL